LKRPEFKHKCKIIFNGEPYTKSNGMKMGYNYKTRKPYAYYEDYIVEYEKALAECALNHCIAIGMNVITGPVRLKILYYFGKRKVKDLQNLPKTTCDALIGSVYRDDNQVCEIIMKKFLDEKRPRVEIEVDEIITDESCHGDLYPVKIRQGEIDSTITSLPKPTKARKPRKTATRRSKTVQKTATKPPKEQDKSERPVAAKRNRKIKESSSSAELGHVPSVS